MSATPKELSRHDTLTLFPMINIIVSLYNGGIFITASGQTTPTVSYTHIHIHIFSKFNIRKIS